MGSWEELILQLVGGITEHGQASSTDELALADLIDCIRWEMASIFQIPGRTISVDLDLRSIRHYTLHLDFGNAIMEGNSIDPWKILGQSILSAFISYLLSISDFRKSFLFARKSFDNLS